MDHHAGFTTSTHHTTREEAALLREADVVIASSEVLAEQARRHRPDVSVVRNGCDFSRFARATTPGEGRPVIGYYGAIADWFDGELVTELARAHPEWDFVLVGSTYSSDLGPLSRLPNVVLTGERPYAELPDWLGRFHVCIIPFRRTRLTEATNPVKVYEMLAAGKPVVAVPLPELVAMAPLVATASSAEEFAQQIAAALAADDDRAREQRRQFAAANTWSARFEEVAALTDAAFPLVSIAIVTYGNRELTWLCLESLYRTLEWPNFEFLVIDNASPDGTPEMLRELAHNRPRLRIVLNDDNRGFATATNQP